MYFDNYLKSNPTSINAKLDNQFVSMYNPHMMQNIQPKQQNKPAFVGQKYSNELQNSNIQFKPLAQQQTYQQKPMMTYHTGMGGNNIPRQQVPNQKPNNNISFNHETASIPYSNQATQFLKRRDSISFNSVNKGYQHHSPSNKSFLNENSIKSNNNLRTTINTNEFYRQTQPSRQNYSNNTSIIMTGKQQDTSLRFQSEKSFKQQENRQKSYETGKPSNPMLMSTFTQSNYSNKPYLTGYQPSMQKRELEFRKNILKTNNDKDNNQIPKSSLYNFQLKNTNVDLSSFAKDFQTQGQYKYFTPNLIKQASDKDKQDVSNVSKREFSKGINQMNKGYKALLEHQQNHKMSKGILERESQLTDREISKSPSFDNLLASKKNKQPMKLQSKFSLNQVVQQQKQQSCINEGSKASIPEPKQFSQTQLHYNYDDTQKNSKPKPYHTLIQNLQKKFSQQKKSSQSFQLKQKTYLQEITKRQQRIKRLQTIVDNNRQTINAMQETIKQLKKNAQLSKSPCKQQMSSTADSGSIKDLQMEQLRRQNGELKEEIKKVKKQLIMIKEEQDKLSQLKIIQKNKYEENIQQLNRALSEIQKQRQSLNLQICKLRQSNSQIHSEYNASKGNHRKTKEQLEKYKKTNQQVQITNRQLSIQLKEIQIKYDRLNIKIEQYENQKVLLNKIIAELNTKNTLLEQKLANLQKQTNELLIRPQTSQSNLSQIEALKQRIQRKQETNSSLAQQLKAKTKQFEVMIFEKSQLETKVQKLQGKLKSAKNITYQNTSPVKQQSSLQISPQKGLLRHATDNIDEITYSPSPNKQIPQYKQTVRLLDFYHTRYIEIASLFNITEKTINQNSEIGSFTAMPLQETISEPVVQSLCSKPSLQYLATYHPALIDQIKKVLKDLKKLVGVLKQTQQESNLKNQRIYQLDKTLKKQGNKINGLIGQIHTKNIAMMQLNKMQMDNQLLRLNEKYQILYSVRNEESICH